VSAGLAESERVTEVIREPYGYVTGATAATNPPRRPGSSQGRPALSGKILILSMFHPRLNDRLRTQGSVLSQ